MLFRLAGALFWPRGYQVTFEPQKCKYLGKEVRIFFNIRRKSSQINEKLSCRGGILYSKASRWAVTCPVFGRGTNAKFDYFGS